MAAGSDRPSTTRGRVCCATTDVSTSARGIGAEGWPSDGHPRTPRWTSGNQAAGPAPEALPPRTAGPARPGQRARPTRRAGRARPGSAPRCARPSTGTATTSRAWWPIVTGRRRRPRHLLRPRRSGRSRPGRGIGAAVGPGRLAGASGAGGARRRRHPRAGATTPSRRRSCARWSGPSLVLVGACAACSTWPGAARPGADPLDRFVRAGGAWAPLPAAAGAPGRPVGGRRRARGPVGSSACWC